VFADKILKGAKRHIEKCLATPLPRWSRAAPSWRGAPGGDTSRPPAPQRGPRRLAFL